MNSKELSKLLKVLRTNGVTHYQTADINLTIAEDFLIQPKPEILLNGDPIIEEEVDPYANFPSGIISDEELQYYANGGEFK